MSLKEVEGFAVRRGGSVCLATPPPPPPPPRLEQEIKKYHTRHTDR